MMREKIERKCIGCEKVLVTRHQVKYCSQKCQATTKYKKSLQGWKEGITNGAAGIQTKVLSASIRRYLFEKYNKECSRCGWGEINPVSGKIPLEIDHIDGNSENNLEENLRLLCPNCHSLTPYFRNLNKGKGRKWRMGSVLEEVSNASHLSF